MNGQASGVQRAIDGLRAAIGFLTRIPISAPRVVMGHAAPWFPFVGLLIGIAHGGMYYGLREVLPALPAAVLSVAGATLITGAFHHDGLADMADAFGGGWDVEQRLAIMKDSRLGTYGTSALVLAFATEISTVSSLDPFEGFQALVVAHTLSRSMAVGAMRDTSLAGDGLGAAYAAQLKPGLAYLALIFGVAVTALVYLNNPVIVLPMLLLAVVARVAVVLLAVRKIGGITGDVLGAVQQMSALAVLVVAAGAAT